MYSWNNTDTENTVLQVVTFRVDREDFAFEILKVKEIIKVPDITMVPKSPYFIKGIINLRGNVIPIVDLRKRFQIEAFTDEKRNRIVVIEEERAQVGFLVDMVLGIKKIEKNSIELPSQIMSNIEIDCISGVARMEDGIIILLDIEKILCEEIEQES